MPESVTLPAWVFVILLIFAALAAAEKLLVPTLRWLVTLPANRMLDELSGRVRIGIRPFQRTQRQALIQRLLADPKVQQAAAQFATEKKIPLEKAMRAFSLRERDRAAKTPTCTFASATGSARIARALYREGRQHRPPGSPGSTRTQRSCSS
jgi:glycerol-3-phosphate O-acyltransferase